MLSRSSLIESRDNLHINNLRLSPSILLFLALLPPTRTTPLHLKRSSPRSQHPSPCRRFVSIVAVSVATSSFSFTWTSVVWSLLRSSTAFMEKARAAVMSSFNFRRSMISPPLVRSPITLKMQNRRPEPKDSWIGTCLNFIHFDIQSSNQDIWPPSKRFVVTPAVYPRLFEILTTLTFGALRKNHIVTNM